MAAVYKALSKSKPKNDEPKMNGVAKENRQRVLMLTSRGVTFRYDLSKDAFPLYCADKIFKTSTSPE
jgi:hypothetical protein